ncbi:DUF1800 domain-containing protein [Fuerstiella marisgermanici]|uniref:DUF1800 domain-containing protein n=1 Tax=Fuerstiella marisgermanici TaxID=1891926 RepID=A0A1P8WMB0_9PLAN|nr:DUF1800 domain-containing protein [Fuerstiella marisgermanici]APZ95198.1 hypothetical protein Fuma_04853 [Fuerstiella marisgermanici]
MNETIDPVWAWAEYQPTAHEPWDVRRAAHLFRRAGFGATRAELHAAVEAGSAATVDSIMQSTTEPSEFLKEVDALATATLATGDVQKLSAWWAYRMLATPAQLLEKMTLFWHGHFATSAAKVDDAQLMFAQNNLLREQALGDFSALLLEISRDPAMLVYLDSASNRKAHPNENYAREIMELFCLGEGNYTEQDIRELARCFTGWEIKREKFRFNRYQHDTGPKNVLGESGKFGGEKGVEIVAAQDAAPLFIATKLVTFFVMEEPQPTEDLIAPLAQELRDNDMQIAPVVRRILSSNLFCSNMAIGRKVRSPVEFAIGFLRSLEGSTNSYELAENLKTLGQGLLYPPSVKGWDGGRTWINSSTLLGRSNLIRHLLDSDKTRFGRESLADYLRSQGAQKFDDVIDLFEETLFAVKIPSAARDRVRQLAGNSGGEDKLKDAVHALCTLPEFQLG